jgi:SAM-dependent methyltransferase
MRCRVVPEIPATDPSEPDPGEPASAPEGARPSPEDIERWIYAYLEHAPLSLALREINRLIAIETVASGRQPVLDVGCGDGFWWTLRDADHREVYGIDISAREVAQARTRIHAALTDVSRERPFPGTEFREIIGNCSLEHVPDIDGALSNLRAAAAPDARLLMFVPTPRWAYQGRMQSWLLRRAPRVAMSLSGALNGFFQHWHLYDAKVWTRLLAQNGWQVRAAYGLGSARSEFLFRAFLPPAFLSFVAKKLTGFYPSRLARLLPRAVRAPAAALVQWAVSDPLVPVDSPTAYEYLIIADASEPPR